MSFVCWIRNVPLAGVLWNGGISFGGVISFIFADPLIIAILTTYRKYYGTKMMLVLLGSFYATMVAAGYAIEFLFRGLGPVPVERNAKVVTEAVQWNYTTWLNIVLLALTVVLVVRFSPLRGPGNAVDDGADPMEWRNTSAVRTTTPHTVPTTIIIPDSGYEVISDAVHVSR